MRRARGVRVWSTLAASVIALAALWGLFSGAATQAPLAVDPLVEADPAPNAILATGPDRITLVLPEAIAPPSASVRLLQAGGEETPPGAVQVDAALPTRIVARPAGALEAGGYVVVWSARAEDDGALLAGAYPFRGGVARNPGAAEVDGAWPRPWATILRWLIFVGTALAAGGFAWARVIAPHPGARTAGSRSHAGVMAIGALLALMATALPPFAGRLLDPTKGSLPPLTTSLREMPLGWWVQLVAVFLLSLLCLGILARGRVSGGLPTALDWLGLGTGLAALAGLSLTSHAGSTGTLESGALAWEIAHQWSTALWVSGLLYLVGGWRGLGTDVARFRTVRWVGGVLLAISVLTGIVMAWRLFPSVSALLGSRYGQVLSGKSAIVLAVLVVGALAMAVFRRANAVRASWSLNTQGMLAMVVVLLSALLALMAAPGTVTLATLAGIALADVVPLDRAAFSAENGTVHLLTQPAAPGRQTIVVRLTDGSGAPLVSDPAPRVDVTWTSLFTGAEEEPPTVATAALQLDASGGIFSGEARFPGEGWWQADVVVTPAGGIASRARFWLVLPDPNVTGRGPTPSTDIEAEGLFARGLQALTALRSVRYTQRLGDGAGSLYRSQTAVSAAEGEQPAAYTDTAIAADGNVVARQTIVGDRRWILAGDDWIETAPLSFTTPAAWGEAYVDATGFQFGPREEIDGELCQVITFWQPPRQSPSRAPAWFAWWIGLASGEVRQEAMVSTRHYMVYRFSDFDVPLGITAPVGLATPAAVPELGSPTPAASPFAEEQP